MFLLGAIVRLTHKILLCKTDLTILCGEQSRGSGSVDVTEATAQLAQWSCAPVSCWVGFIKLKCSLRRGILNTVPLDSCESVISQNLAKHQINSRGKRECRSGSKSVGSGLIFAVWFCGVSKRPQTSAQLSTSLLLLFLLGPTSLVECWENCSWWSYKSFPSLVKESTLTRQGSNTDSAQPSLIGSSKPFFPQSLALRQSKSPFASKLLSSSHLINSALTEHWHLSLHPEAMTLMSPTSQKHPEHKKITGTRTIAAKNSVTSWLSSTHL